MIGLLCFVLAAVASPFKSKMRLEAENAVLRHQLIVLRRRLHGRVRLTNHDRWFFIQLYRWFPAILQVLTIVRPETLVRWHRAGFRCYWRWKSRARGGRPKIETDLRVLIRRMNVENGDQNTGSCRALPEERGSVCQAGCRSLPAGSARRGRSEGRTAGSIGHADHRSAPPGGLRFAVAQRHCGRKGGARSGTGPVSRSRIRSDPWACLTWMRKKTM
jgi:hypothetical protein